MTRLSTSSTEIDLDKLEDTPKLPRKLSLMERYAQDMARKPCVHMCTALVIGLALSVIGIIVGNFSVQVDSAGWTSRGTLIANRQMQTTILLYNQEKLFGNGTAASDEVSSETWNDLIDNEQRNLDTDDDSTNNSEENRIRERRALLSVLADENYDQKSSFVYSLGKSSLPTPHFIKSFNRMFGDVEETAAVTLKDINVRDLLHKRSPRLRELDENTIADVTGLKGCDANFYTNNTVIYGVEHLWPIWKFKPSSASVRVTDQDSSSPFVDSRSLRDICLAEQNTLQILSENDLCTKCDNGRCLPPYSVVLFARINVGDLNLTLSCDQLGEAWERLITESSAATSDSAKSFLNISECGDELVKTGYGGSEDDVIPDICPQAFHPLMIDEQYSSPNENRYTSSIFATKTDEDSLQSLFDLAEKYDRAQVSETVKGTYDTQYETFVNNAVDNALGRDMILALGSGVVTALAMLVHTKSSWLTSIGLLQVIISFPLSYFVYSIIARLEFFPFLNFIGVFVSFALGSDDVFVAVDKWKNARHELLHKNGVIPTTVEVAILALPDAAVAMFLTSFTTAIAFFGTAICPIAPLKMFAIFNGLLISFDYIMCVLLVFPALVLYDKWLLGSSVQKKSVNSFIAFGGGKRQSDVYGRSTLGNSSVTLMQSSKDEKEESSNEDTRETGDRQDEADGQVGKSEEIVEKRESLIHRVLSWYFDALYKIRYVLLLAIIGTFVFVVITAAKLSLPQSSDVRLLNDKIQYEENYEWRKTLLSSVLQKQAGSQAFVVWGLKAEDHGNVNNPRKWSNLVLDDNFDPTTESAQMFLLDFCGAFFSTQYAKKIDQQYICPMDAFNMWLQNQSSLIIPDEVYVTSCGNATSLPVPPDIFDSCIIGWSENVSFNMQILQRDGVVAVMYIPYQSRVRYDSPYTKLNDEWNSIEHWMNNVSKHAPDSVNGMFSTSEDFWWYDTTGNMLRSAYGSAGIALAASFVVVLFAMRSLTLSAFSLFTVSYILAAVTAMLVGSGWTLGFLEAICLSILIGISCDFVLHLGHAYTILPGTVSAMERSRFAVIHMGPSILAAAFTTIAAATLMIFTVITFFRKFAVILFYTIITATLGSNVIFVTIAATFGPSEPTVLIDSWIDKCCKKKNDKDVNEEILPEQHRQLDEWNVDDPDEYEI